MHIKILYTCIFISNFVLLFVHNISSFLVTFARFYLKNSDACNMSDMLVKIVKVINVTAHALYFKGTHIFFIWTPSTKT